MPEPTLDQRFFTEFLDAELNQQLTNMFRNNFKDIKTFDHLQQFMEKRINMLLKEPERDITIGSTLNMMSQKLESYADKLREKINDYRTEYPDLNTRHSAKEKLEKQLAGYQGGPQGRVNLQAKISDLEYKEELMAKLTNINKLKELFDDKAKSFPMPESKGVVGFSSDFKGFFQPKSRESNQTDQPLSPKSPKR